MDWIITDSRARAIFLLINNFKTLNLINEKWKLAYLDQYCPIKNIKGSMGQQYPLSRTREGKFVVIIHISGAGAILLLFFV